nr:reverse transcriptase domain-containing protein [Tanacetum cinerariifolium]
MSVHEMVLSYNSCSVGIRRVVPRNYNIKGERFLIASRFPTPPFACAFFSLRAIETSSSKLARDQTSNPTSFTNPTPKGRIRRSSKQKQKFDESFHEAWERYKDLLRACPHHGFTELHQLDTFYNALNPADQDSLNAAVGGNLLEKSPQDALTITENKSKVRNSQSKLIASPVNACDNHSSSELAKFTHAVNQQTSGVTTAMTCLAAGGNTFPKYRDNIQGYISAAAGNYNQGNPGYRPQEMILRDGDERLTLNMKHDTASYSNHPYRDSVNVINIFNLSSEDCLEDLVSNKQSGNPTFLLHKEIVSPKVIHEFHDSKGYTLLSEELPDIDSFNDIHPYFDDDPLSGSTTYSANSLLEEFAAELALISYPLDYDDNCACDIEYDIREIEFLLFQEIESDAIFDDDSFDSEGEKIKEAELLIDPLDLPCDILSDLLKGRGLEKEKMLSVVK